VQKIGGACLCRESGPNLEAFGKAMPDLTL
jgi:hypothetical protein